MSGIDEYADKQNFVVGADFDDEEDEDYDDDDHDYDKKYYKKKK